MIDVYEYIKKPKTERQAHLQLDLPCIERGGTSISERYRGLLADFLDTTMPSGSRVYLCHACNNPKCGNKYHLYWGTPKDNFQDRPDKHLSIWDRMVEKYGLEEAKKKQSRKGIKNPKISEKLRGKPKSEEQKKKISETLKGHKVSQETKDKMRKAKMAR